MRFGHNYSLEGTIDLRPTRLNCILQDLFRDTPLDHIWCAQMCVKNAYLAIFGIFGLSAQTKHIGIYLCCFQCNIALQCIKSKTTVDKDVTQPAISAFDHFAIDASTQHTASHQEVFFQGARLHHQGRPWVQRVWGVGAHL